METIKAIRAAYKIGLCNKINVYLMLQTLALAHNKAMVKTPEE